MVEDLKIPVELMMENAGHCLAQLTMHLYRNKHIKAIQVISGSGNNGGGGLVAARRLKAWNRPVEVYIPQGINSLRSLPQKQLERVIEIKVPVKEEIPTSTIDKSITIDAYLGYGFSKRSDSISDSVFKFLSNHPDVLSLDVPSGLDSNTGEGTCNINPRATLSLAFPKIGLLRAEKTHVGNLFVGDIGIPPSIYQTDLGIEWSKPYHLSDLNWLRLIFESSSLAKINRKTNKKKGLVGWVPKFM
jgi:NAD(P)H-hydrate epimerase